MSLSCRSHRHSGVGRGKGTPNTVVEKAARTRKSGSCRETIFRSSLRHSLSPLSAPALTLSSIICFTFLPSISSLLSPSAEPDLSHQILWWWRSRSRWAIMMAFKEIPPAVRRQEDFLRRTAEESIKVNLTMHCPNIWGLAALGAEGG